MAKKAEKKSVYKIWAVLRIMLGLIFLWAFMDKMFGLGYSTCRTVDPKTKAESVVVMCDKSVAKGGSATNGFLKNATSGPLEDFYKGLAGNTAVDVLFMGGLLLIGLALVSGVGVKVASVSGVLMLMMMWSAVLPPANNPVLDDHVVYSVVLLGVMATNSSQVWGLGKWWQQQEVVKKMPILA